MLAFLFVEQPTSLCLTYTATVAFGLVSFVLTVLWWFDAFFFQHLGRREGGLAPHGLGYDRRNNIMWGWDPVLKKV